MPFQEQESTEAELLQRKRCERFAAQAADRIRATEPCVYSLLPHDELSRMAGAWYEGCAQAMLRGNYAPLDAWVRSQSRLAAAQGFAPGDLFQLMQICRQSAIETENWNEDIFSAVDEVIHEVLTATCAKISWDVTDSKANAPAESEAPAPTAEPEIEEQNGERRRFARNRLCLPIRVLSSRNGGAEDVTRTQSISRGGLYFLTSKEYKYDQALRINFPFWNEPGGINREYAAKVVRVDPLPDNTWGVGIDFTESLGRKRNLS